MNFKRMFHFKQVLMVKQLVFKLHIGWDFLSLEADPNVARDARAVFGAFQIF